MNDNIVFGINSVKSMLTQNPHLVIEFFAQAGKSQKKSELIALAKKHSIPVKSISKQKITKHFGDCNHQGVFLKIKATKILIESEFFANFDFNNSKNIFLILDEIQDPHNFGAILRTANALGVAAVIITKDKSVGVNAAVRKVSCGASEITPIVRVNNLSRFLKELKQKGVWVVGTILDENSEPLSTFKCSGPVALVVGREGKGMRELTAKNCDYLVHIPMEGEIESLNVSVATGIFLYSINLKTAIELQ